jgi:hypothetical protein
MSGGNPTLSRTGRVVLVRKAALQVGDPKEIPDAVEALAQYKKVGRFVRPAEMSLDANLSCPDSSRALCHSAFA